MQSIHIKITYTIATSKVQPKKCLNIQNGILHIRFSLIVCNQWQYEPGFGPESHSTYTMESPRSRYVLDIESCFKFRHF